MKLVFPAIVLLLAFAAKAEEMVVDGRTWSYTTYTNNGYEYLAEVTGVYPNGGDVVIPEQLRVGDRWSSVYASPVLIKQAVFEYCDTLESISIPDSVMYIDPYAFQFCTSLKSVKLAANLTGVGGCSFMCCTRLVSVKIPGNLKCIAPDMFRSCYALEKVEIEEGVESVESTAFDQCGNLTTVTIPSTLKNWFEFPRSVTTVYVSGGDTKRVKDMLAQGTYGLNIDEISFVEKALPDGGPYVEVVDGITYKFFIENREATIRLGSYYAAIPTSTSGALVIPSTLGGCPVTTIGDYAFYDCSSLTSVTIPDSVTTIGEDAFCYCDSLTSVTIPDSVTTIGDYAFGFTSLTSVTIPESVTTIGERAFYYCSSLTSVTIPEGVKTIASYAFQCCRSLTSITIPDSVMTIGSEAFWGCSSLTSITIPYSVMTIRDYAFFNCSSLTTVYVDSGDTERVRELMRGKGIDVDNLTFVETAYKLKIDENGCLTGYEGELPSELVLPDGINRIEAWTFEGCASLESVIIPEGVREIGYGAFDGCSTLSSISVPDSVVLIERGAFAGTPFYENQQSRLVVIGSVFFGIKAGCLCPDSITIPEGVATIGYNAFYDCGSLESITLPGSLKTICSRAFEGCRGLQSVVIPDGVTTIEYEAFACCVSLQSIVIPSSVSTIGEDAFAWRDSPLIVYTDQGDVERVRSLVAETGADLSQFVFIEREGEHPSDSVDDGEGDKIVWETVENSDGTLSITGTSELPEDFVVPSVIGGKLVTAIASGAFSGKSLNSVVVPEGVVSIASGAFSYQKPFEGDVSRLKRIELPSTLEKLGGYSG